MWGVGCEVQGVGCRMWVVTVPDELRRGRLPAEALQEERPVVQGPLYLRWFNRFVNAVSSHESATFRGGGGHFCGMVTRLATRQRLLDVPAHRVKRPH